MNNLVSCKNVNYTNTNKNTTNSLCITYKKHNIFSSTKTVQVGNILYRIPCFILPYIPELKFLLQKVNIKEAIKILAEKYKVSLRPPIQNIRRYIYPTANYKVIPPVTQFSVTFKLTEKAIVNVPLPSHPKFIQMHNDARYISVCNNDTFTFSDLVSDMIKNNSYWFSTLPIFTTHYLYAAIDNSSTILTSHTGYVIMQNNRLIFLPTISNELIFLYQKYVENSSFVFLYVGRNFGNATTLIQNLYFSSPLSCYFKNI
jgi:hypothetical protein